MSLSSRVLTVFLIAVMAILVSASIAETDELLDRLRSSNLTKHWHGFHRYKYDGLSPPIDRILDGGDNMYDHGNQVHYTAGGVESVAVYNLSYRLDSYTFATLAVHPFIAFFNINATEPTHSSYSIRVVSDLGADGNGSFQNFSGSVSVSGYDLFFKGAQVYGAGVPSVCEVYFYFSQNQTGKTFSFSTLYRDRKTMYNIAQLSGNVDKAVLSYILLSTKSPGRRILQDELEATMLTTLSVMTNQETSQVSTAKPDVTTPQVSSTPSVEPTFLKQLGNLNPADAEELINIENQVEDFSRRHPETNGTSYDYGDTQLHIVVTNIDRQTYNSILELGSSHIEFTLQTNNVSRLVSAVLVFKLNTTGTAQTQPIKAGSLATTRYISPENTTYFVIVGLNADSFPRSSKATAGDDQLPGNASFIGPSTSPESVCKKIEAEKKNTSNLMINKLEPICLYYDRVEMKYSDRGCVTITDNATGNVTCKCNHLTTFTVLLAVQSTVIPKGVKITSYTIESVSVMFLVATIVILYKSKHSGDRVPVQINLSVALLLFHAFNLSHDLAVMHEVSCVILTATVQYHLLCAEMWFLVEGTRLFLATSNPVDFQTQDPIKRLKIFMLIGWLLPAFIVGTSMAVGFFFGIYMKAQPLYEQCNEFSPFNKYDRCWLAPGTPIFYALVVAPLALVLLINFMIILKTTHVMLNSRRMRNRGENPGTGDAFRAAKSFFFLFLLLGGTWIFSFFTGIGNEISNEVFMYIHGLVNGSQGIVVFLLYCVMNDDIRKKILPCKRKADVGSEPQVNAANAQRGENLNN